MKYVMNAFLSLHMMLVVIGAAAENYGNYKNCEELDPLFRKKLTKAAKTMRWEWVYDCNLENGAGFYVEAEEAFIELLTLDCIEAFNWVPIKVSVAKKPRAVKIMKAALQILKKVYDTRVSNRQRAKHFLPDRIRVDFDTRL